jgi:secreted PhoX family phosphatase
MKKIIVRATVILPLAIMSCYDLSGQHISEFNSLAPSSQDSRFHLPTTHTFQYIIESGDILTNGETSHLRNDFAGYIPINGSSTLGHLSINSEGTPGGVTILDVELSHATGEWIINNSQKVNFNPVAGTARNCSGAVTPWGTIITCEEAVVVDTNADGYNDIGWAIEIDPITKTVIDQDGGLDGPDKLWALGNFKHENAIVHKNRRTIYQGVDDSNGYLYKFVANEVENLSAGVLYVYKGSKNGSGEWILLNNSTPEEQNTVLSQSQVVGATIFKGIEDVDISPIDGKVYLAVKSESRVYRFEDSHPITGTSVTQFETYVGGQNYEINDGENVTSEPWGTGNDNLAFDDLGNLWVTQDGGLNYIWLVENGHTQLTPRVKIFGRSPSGSEPTGITFTPDYKYMFMSIQHPSGSNNVTNQEDAFGISRTFDKDVTIVIARTGSLNTHITALASPQIKDHELQLYPNPVDDILTLDIAQFDVLSHLSILDLNGKDMSISWERSARNLNIETAHLSKGIYLVRMLLNDNWVTRKIVIGR